MRLSNNKSSKSSKAATRKTAIASVFETLEDRRLFSVSLTSGVLNINTGAEADNISIDYVSQFDPSTGSDFNAYISGAGSGPSVVAAEDISEIKLNTGAGNDTVNIDFCGASASVYADLGDGNDSLIMNDGSDNPATVYGGAGDDTIDTLGSPDDLIDGGTGNNTINNVPQSSGPDTAITGTIFNDANQNWLQDSGEYGISGVKVFLDANNDGKLDNNEAWTTTDNNGQYAFDNVKPGTQRVCEVMPAGFRNVVGTASEHIITAVSGKTSSSNNFDLTSNALVTGTVVNDANGNGKQDGSEKGLSGWRVYIDLNKDGKWESAENSKITDASGKFSFTGLKFGTYEVRVVAQNGQHQTTPANNGFYKVTISAGDIVTLNFGEKKN